MLTTFVVPLDGSPLAERALPYATKLAQAAKGWLILARITSPRGLLPPEREREVAVEMEAVARRVRASSVAVDPCICHA